MSALTFSLPSKGAAFCADETIGYIVVQSPNGECLTLEPPPSINQQLDPIVFGSAM